VSFIDVYNEVFDEQGQVKACGRAKCKELIHEAKKLDPNTNFGSENNGYMNKKNIKELYKREKSND
jgi:hypothetical protein